MKQDRIFRIKWWSKHDSRWYYASGTAEEIDAFLDMFCNLKWRMI